MTQLFNSGADHRDMYETFLFAKRGNFNDLVLMYGGIIGSRALGQALYDSGALNFSFEVDREYFLENYVAILSAMQNAGTFETYITLIKNLIGQNSTITFETPEKGHLKIKVLEGDFIERRLITHTGAWLSANTLDQDDPVGIIATTKLSEYTLNQATNVIKNLTPAGIFVEVSFRGDE